MRTIVVNSVVADGQNNKLIYKFPNSVEFKDAYVSVASVSMFYSWFNISAALGNNIFQYIWYNETGNPAGDLVTVTFADGIYDITTLNQALQFHFISKGRYLTTSTGSNYYFVNMIVNPATYRVDFFQYAIPTALQAAAASLSVPTGGFNTAPETGIAGLPTQAFTPPVVIVDNFSTFVGISAGQGGSISLGFWPGAFVVSASSPNWGLAITAPQVQPNYSLLITSSVVDNPYAQPSSVIYSITPNVGIGEIISEKPPSFMWNKLRNGTYNELRLGILGTNLQPIIINDPSISIVLVIADANEVLSK